MQDCDHWTALTTSKGVHVRCFADTYMSKAEAPSRSLMMSLVNRRVGPESITQRFWKTKMIKLFTFHL